MVQAQILLTNDDGILSPGLWAAASALSELGFVHVAAPRDQYSAAARSMPSTSDGIIEVREVSVNGQTWQVHAVGGTPAQAVQHGVLEIAPVKPDLVVAGINFGENPGSGVTISGTIGAALEGASLGIPALAVSLETEQKHHYSHSDEVDFSAAAYFTQYFARLLLSRRMPADVDVLKVDIPCDATKETPWAITRQSRRPYFQPTVPERDSWDTPVRIGYHITRDFGIDAPETDIYTVFVRRIVSATPLSLDLTSRIDLTAFERELKQD